ncbi:MHYT domain-containing protein [Aquimonas voraii]|uniref:MHYT domain-containing protein, NO-binding membrane sensor n=1 Tax=Aquimonas voraii TaxID=265719 RepID=A0A1G6SNT2_9GAMM|nr:MHYT domain-containing protein [Aquimonas voraii]SDD17887.1 MHYT domain-containing protein, NO-binding membrane sensor [Aquimonas voraii]
MQGTYETPLVVLSVFIAALASYVAIEFAGRVDGVAGRRRGWLLAGALAMGSGIWSMHFVGMTAFELPVAISFDLGITVLSWVAAVAVSALALVLVTGSGLNRARIAYGALAMGAGICLMHYGGMWAMRMEPGIGYDPVWFTVSVLIAVSASAAALFVVAQLKVVASWRDIGLRLGAAGIMGLAVAGMHYSGMAAARFDANAFCASSNALSAEFMSTPVVILSLLGLAIAIAFAVADAREVLRREREARAEAARVKDLAFIDGITGLANRPRLGQWVTARLARGARFSLLSIGIEAGSGRGDEDLKTLALALQRGLRNIGPLARSGSEQLTLVLDTDDTAALLTWSRSELMPLLAPLSAAGLGFEFGLAIAPADGGNAQMLLLRAGARAGSLEWLIEQAAEADGLGAAA